MCDFSLQAVKSRDAQVADKLVTTNFGTGTTGFAGVDDPTTAVCVRPGTEIAFDEPIRRACLFGPGEDLGYRTAIFRQLHKDERFTHHDALEFADGSHLTLNQLFTGQHATVLQLPAAPKTAAEAQEQERLPVNA